MPELKEVFEMVTKQTEPDLDAWRDQEQRQRRASRNRKVGAFAVAAALLGIAAIVAVNSLPRGGTDRTGDDPTGPVIPPSGRFFLDLGTGETRPLPDGIPKTGTFYAVSPDGTMVATNPCCSGNNPLWIVNIDGTDLRLIAEGEMDGFGPDWSPDGSMLVYQGRDGSTEKLGNLFVVDMASGERTRVTNLEQKTYGFWFLSPSFTPDGRSILFHLPRGPDFIPAGWDLWSVPIDGGEPTLVRRDASRGAYSVDERLAYVDPSPGDWSSDVLIVDLPLGATGIVARGEEIAFPRWSPDGTRIAYVDGGSVYVVDIETRETSRVAEGGSGEWFDEDTLIISPDTD